MNAKKSPLGRGLGALLGDAGSTLEDAAKTGLQEVPVELLQRGRFQPRGVMDQAALEELRCA